MQNKTIILILLFAFLVIQNLRSQCVMIKAIAYLTPINLGYDFGIEAKLSNQWSGQLSYTIARKFEGDDTDMKYLHAFQIRRYFTDDFQKAFYLGGVLQKYFLN